MTAIYLVSGLMLLIAAVLAVIRAERGPSMLDRTMALDLFATVVVAGIAIEAAWSRRTDTLPVLVALSMVGFVSSVVISRFASVEPSDLKRIRTAAEIEQEKARVRAAEDAADEADRLAHERLRAQAAQARDEAEAKAAAQDAHEALHEDAAHSHHGSISRRGEGTTS